MLIVRLKFNFIVIFSVLNINGHVIKCGSKNKDLKNVSPKYYSKKFQKLKNRRKQESIWPLAQTILHKPPNRFRSVGSDPPLFHNNPPTKKKSKRKTPCQLHSDTCLEGCRQFRALSLFVVLVVNLRQPPLPRGVMFGDVLMPHVFFALPVDLLFRGLTRTTRKVLISRSSLSSVVFCGRVLLQ